MFTKLLSIAAFAGAALAVAVPSTSGLDLSGYPEDSVVGVFPNGLPEKIKATLVNGTSANGAAVDKRASKAGVYLCTDSYFNGYCVHIVQPLYQCVSLSGDLNDKVSSVGPDKPFYCYFYSNNNCNDSENHFGTYNPGYNDLSQVPYPGGNWNDRISSYSCNPN